MQCNNKKNLGAEFFSCLNAQRNESSRRDAGLHFSKEPQKRQLFQKKNGSSRMGSEKKQTLLPGDFPNFKYEARLTLW